MVCYETKKTTSKKLLGFEAVAARSQKNAKNRCHDELLDACWRKYDIVG